MIYLKQQNKLSFKKLEKIMNTKQKRLLECLSCLAILLCSLGAGLLPLDRHKKKGRTDLAIIDRSEVFFFFNQKFLVGWAAKQNQIGMT